jgi:Molybdopterin oxidoreductase
MFDGGYAGSVSESGDVQAIARKLGLEVTLHEARRPEDFASVFEAIEGQADALYVVENALMVSNRALIVMLALKRLLYPLRRTRPKGDPDPGWQRISWDEALDMTASAMQRIATQHGPAAVAFSLASPSTTALADAGGWIRRLMNAFGTPNAATSLDLCGWGRGFATRYRAGPRRIVPISVRSALPAFHLRNPGSLVLYGMR